MEQVLNRFCLDGCPVSCERYGEGHINLTFLVVTDTAKRYILQRLSRAAFSDIHAGHSHLALFFRFRQQGACGAEGERVRR